MLELPALEQFAEEAAPKGIQLVSINVKGTPATVRRLSAHNKLPVLLDRAAKVADQYKVPLQPYTIVISNARVSARFAGSRGHVTLLGALRAATGITGQPAVEQAGVDCDGGTRTCC